MSSKPSLDIRFTNEYAPSRLDEIVSFMMGPRLWVPHTDYPDFLDWADKSYKQLLKEKKRALLAISHGEVIGVTVYQNHTSIKNALELKNLTVRPDMRGRYIASFLLRNTEIEGRREFKSSVILCDAKANHFEVQLFLQKHQYSIVGKHDLYNLKSGKDFVYRKKLGLF